MRTQPHKSQNVGIGLLIDQNEVRLHMAVTVIFPVASQGVIAVTWLQRFINQQGRQHGVKVGLECAPVPAFGLALVIPFELAGVVRRPH